MADRSNAKVRSALVELTIARLKEAVRDPTALFWTFGFPVLLALALGVAFRSAPARVHRVGVVCTEPAGCEAVLPRLSRDGRLAPSTSDLRDALTLLRRAKVDVVLEVRGPGKSVVYHFDPTQPEARVARLEVSAALTDAPSRFSGRDELHTEVGSRYVDLLVPGLAALNLMGGGVWGTSLSVVDARRKKLLRQLAVTPMRRSDYLLSYMISRLVFLVLELAFLMSFGALAFQTRVTGTFTAFGALSVLGAFTFTGLGLLIGARTSSPEVVSGWANLLTIPMSLFSGTFFSYEQFPKTMQPIIHAMPLTALSDALRAVANEAAPLTACASEMWVLSAWAIVSFGLALRWFRWQ